MEVFVLYLGHRPPRYLLGSKYIMVTIATCVNFPSHSQTDFVSRSNLYIPFSLYFPPLFLLYPSRQDIPQVSLSKLRYRRASEM
jgi:hypothetical protein